MRVKFVYRLDVAAFVDIEERERKKKMNNMRWKREEQNVYLKLTFISKQELMMEKPLITRTVYSSCNYSQTNKQTRSKFTEKKKYHVTFKVR